MVNVEYRTTVMVASVAMRAVICEEFPGYWVAQVLEKDIQGQGSTLEMAFEQVQQRILKEVTWACKRNRLPFLDEGQAPRDYWKRYELAVDLPTAVEISA